MLGKVLLILVVIHLVAMIIGPWQMQRGTRIPGTRRRGPVKPGAGRRALFMWLGFFAGYCICNRLLKHSVGIEQVLNPIAIVLLAVASWVAFLVGLAIAAVALAKSSRVRKSQLG